ncbi:hypothetical protein GCM10010172_07090 [Paractinoplanes ferrugineus]|uniref:PIN domain-containing protein n=1 Tax=Paractinoplanes ferrugineus TaxID=113564 RepID=A0A919MHW9_9ACTN|nr:hypothetical protein [Actinoplanes ferrugineus]GIE16263.1 hypothetical protein Afe05nite_81030 [Actinoplanes ferrugineus]
MSDDARLICLVFDTTAITAWVREAVSVVELISEINDEDGAVLIPLPCLIEAGHLTGMLQQERLQLLLDHPATFLIVDDPDDWKALAGLRSLTDRHDLASAAWLALENDVLVMTRDPRWYSSVHGGRVALHFDD